jgi:hypothetical protein
MSTTTPLELRTLESALRDRGSVAYVLTVSDHGTPHVVQADVLVDGGTVLAHVGERTTRHACARPQVSLLYPARGDNDYSLIVDAVATVVGDPGDHRLALSPTRAILHRPGPPPDPTSSCGSDCVPLSLRTSR